MNWLHYLVEANIYLCVFYLFYCLFLTNETHYTLNRVYLLASCVISFVIPVIQLGSVKNLFGSDQVAYVIHSPQAYNLTTVNIIPSVEVPHFTLQDGLILIYLLGVAVSFILLAIKFYRLYKIGHTYKANGTGNYKLVLMQETNTAFSFFNYLFIGTNTVQNEMIIRHELVHIRQKHSFDIVLLELLKTINWFNPILYLLQNSLKTIHEYIADELTAINSADTYTYASFLVNNAYGIGGSSITHSFFNYNLLKKRIIMLDQQRSGNLARLKYLVALPICAVLLCASTLAFSKTYGWIDLAPKKAGPSVNLKTKHNRKTLKLVKGDTVAYSDEMTIHDKTYHPNTITHKDEAALSKTYGIKLSVVTTNARPGTATLFFPTPAKPHIVKQEAIGVKIKNEDHSAITPMPVDTTPGHEFDPLYSKLQRSIHYPAYAFENNITGKVFACFTVDADHKIKTIAILRGPSEVIDREVLRVLKAIGEVSAAKPGINYNLPINFIVDNYNGPATIDKNFKKMGDDIDPSNTSVYLSEVVIATYIVKNN